MTGFAGARSLDERRRRRLATGSETVAFEAVAEPTQRRAPRPKLKRSRGPAHFPLRKVISIRYWKLATIILSATAVAAGILAGGWAATTYTERLGPGFVLMFRLDAAPLVRGFAAIGFLLAGELALLIGWARSQSLQDFNGRYRGWVFCGVLGFLAAVGLETQLTAAWSATASWLWPAPFSHKATWLWLAPTAFCALFVHTYVVREMRGCRVSLTFAWLASVLGCAIAAIVLSRPLPFPGAQARLVECGVALSFVVCVFSSLLFHARHVVYVCVDPPAIGPSRVKAIWSRFRPWSLFKFKRAGSKDSRKPADRSTVTAVKRRTPKRPVRRKAAPAEPQSPAEEADIEETDDAESPGREAERATVPERASKPVAAEMRASRPTVESRRVASPLASPPSGKTVAPAVAPTAAEVAPPASRASNEGGSFQGMSRRERRLLQKQMRDERAPLRRSA
jgi:hypothetical protein